MQCAISPHSIQIHITTVFHLKFYNGSTYPAWLIKCQFTYPKTPPKSNALESSISNENKGKTNASFPTVTY